MKSTAVKLLHKYNGGLSFSRRVFMLIFGLMFIQLTFVTTNFHRTLLDTLEDQVGTRALIQAQEIASDPELIQEVRIKNIAAIERVTDRLHKISDASFIVIGDEVGVRLSHPDKDKIGLPMQGGDNAGALQRGESYVSIREGSLGYGVRGKTPIIDFDGNTIGVVSVGYLLNRFDQWVVLYFKPLVYELLVTLILTLIGAWLFSKHIKKKMNGMEPSEIALALHLQESILSSVYEGVIAIDKQGKTLAVNRSAVQILGIDQHFDSLKNNSVLEFITNYQFFFKTPYEDNLKDEIIILNGKTVIASRVAIYDDENLIGWVISFRAKNDINSLTAELTQIKQYTENLRVMRHEHANKLSTISGLIEIGEYKSALEIINSENNKKQQLIDFITSRILLKKVAGILLGKYSRARELGIDLQFDPTCQLMQVNAPIESIDLSAIIGNLIDNAFEATLKNPESNKVVTVLITDAGDDLVIEISDNGCGISDEIASTIFSRGVTSKGDNEGHGIGLYLIQRYVTNAGGVILVDDAEPKGTTFSIFIPNKAQNHELN
ncbi:ATP-binding protein [Vibrio panuliri]|uniref:histidine kinase n=1 Tax=Vibrio panuliri TaxID=1381081 RepID=A0ABX3FMN2_9VIBR|nr:sensor histidine kinase [Vibrio panuliri]KAB1457515.1 sensor histidine kinase [Vibrio panuliri]OLQ95495.1 ATPase [Vibrio panuliri]